MKQPAKKIDTCVKIGNKIQQCRTKAGLTQEQVAERVGITQKHLSRIEQGYHNPHFETIIAIANAIGTPIDAFVRDLEGNENSALKNIIISELSNMNSSQLEMLRDNIMTIKKYDFK